MNEKSTLRECEETYGGVNRSPAASQAPSSARYGCQAVHRPGCGRAGVVLEFDDAEKIVVFSVRAAHQVRLGAATHPPHAPWRVPWPSYYRYVTRKVKAEISFWNGWTERVGQRMHGAVRFWQPALFQNGIVGIAAIEGTNRQRRKKRWERGGRVVKEAANKKAPGTKRRP